jgi:transposase
MVGRRTRPLNRTEERWAAPPWGETCAERREVGGRIPADHLVRMVDAAVDGLDLSELADSYAGRGSRPLPPDLMLKLVLYEFERGRTSPADWFRDTRESDPVRWLVRGLRPSRAACYEFRGRIAGFLDGWNRQVLRGGIEGGLLVAERAALDGTTVAACASRHVFVREETLERRLLELDEAIDRDETGDVAETPRRWMARHPETRLEQRVRYRRARTRLTDLQAWNLLQPSDKRRDPARIVVSLGDPDAAPARDKWGVFRPLYNAVLLQDLDSPFVLGYAVFNRAGDADTLEPVLDSARALTGRDPTVLLGDATFAAVSDLAVCAARGVTLYAPVGRNDYTERNGRRPATNQFTRLPKTEFAWHEEEQTYTCPEGRRLAFEGRSTARRAGGRSIAGRRFRCAPEHRLACPRRRECTPRPEKGRSVTRMDGEELLDELRTRMATDEARTLYRRRGSTIELRFADLKQHRGLRQLTSRGHPAARAEVATAVLAHNLLTLHRKPTPHPDALPPPQAPEKLAA